MKQTITLLLFTLVLNISLSAQKFSAAEKINISKANNAFFAAYYEEALSLYKSIQSKHLGSSILNYRIGFCYLELGDYEDFWNIIDKLKKEGAEDILVCPIEKMVL